MPPVRQRGQFRGILFPGYRYLGPFNPLDNGEPVNKADEAAKRHDLAYNQYLNKGLNPYLKFNKADQQLIDDLSDDSSLGGKFARGVFSVKRALAPSLDEKQLAPGRSAEQKQERKLYFARLNKGAKRQRLNPPTEKPTSNPDNSNMEAEQPMEEEAAPQMATARSGGGAGGGPANAGTGGVGMSTGQWIGGTIITPNKFITRNTRQWWCDIKNEHRYKRITNDSGARLYGFSTPWSYFNFNQYNGHFSPKEWQTLLNVAEKFRPVRMTVKIYNIQIKQIVNNLASGDTLYQNDLTAGLHIFCDGEHAFPYTQNPWDRGTMPELPTEPWELQQYAYVTCPVEAIDDSGSNTYETNFLRQEPLYFLEQADHMIVRTGEAVQFHHEFDCGWVYNTRSSQTPANMSFNPLVLSKEVYRFVSGEETISVLSKARQKTGYWAPGPGQNHQANSRISNNPESIVAPQVSFYDGRGQTNDSGGNNSILESGVNIGTAVGSRPPKSNADFIYYCPRDDPTAEHPIEIAPVNTGTRSNDHYTTGENGNTFTNNNPNWMLPNQAWDSANITRYNPIWVKTPRVDRSTMIDTRDGTLPMAHPPGTIYLKLANIPVPTDAISYLNVYATGNVSVEIEWEYTPHVNKNWRPEYRITSETMENWNCYKVDTNGGYEWPEHFSETMTTRFGMEKVL
uniref:Minor capsid protein VP1 n=2 Tax=Dromedary camel bocaparvovirus 1 TaxID=2014603 RepID=A0A1Z3FVQ3_9VIRU|nr:VP1 [Dromedary camel bocaparvovirus 1]